MKKKLRYLDFCKSCKIFYFHFAYYKEKVFKQQIDLLEDNEKELAKKNVNNLKIIRLLTEKCRSQESVINELEEKYNELKEVEANNLQLTEKVHNLEYFCLGIFFRFDFRIFF